MKFRVEFDQADGGDVALVEAETAAEAAANTLAWLLEIGAPEPSITSISLNDEQDDWTVEDGREQLADWRLDSFRYGD